MQHYQDLNESFLKFITAVHVSAYSAIVRCVEIRGNYCAFRTTAMDVFSFIIFLNEASVVPFPMPLVCLLPTRCTWWTVNKTENKLLHISV
jgi:hypothetical protein